MIVLNCEQGSAAWFAARNGLPTASQFHRILTPTTRKPSAQQDAYLCELLAEWATGEPHGADHANGFMQRGTLLEPEALRWFEFEHNVTVDRVGCVLRDDKLVACSPDGLVGDDEGVEVKCPAASTHVRNLLQGLDGYWCQIQGSLWITERKRWTLLSYHPSLPPVEVSLERDESFIAALASEVNRFLDLLQTARVALLERGCAPKGMTLAASQMAVGEEPF
jgi:hypothetical protein